MIDTVKIASLILNIPLPEELKLRGWQRKYDEKTGETNWFYKEKGKKTPYISFYQSPVKTKYLLVNVSLPAFFRGSNAILLDENEVKQALKKLGDYVTEKSGIEFDAEKATVWNIHFAKDYYVGEDLIRPMIKGLTEMSISRFDSGGYGETTCYFHSKGTGKEKKKPRTICIYGKHADTIAKGFPKEDISATKGMLRAEYRYRDKRAVKRLCRTLKLSSNECATLLTKVISEKVLEPLEKQILLLKNAPSARNKIYKLIETYGKRHGRILIAFLINRDVFGANFYKNNGLGYSRSNYFACERKCRQIGIWSLIEETNIPIEIGNLP